MGLDEGLSTVPSTACLKRDRPRTRNRTEPELNWHGHRLRQTRGSAEPQCSQNLLPSFRLALQLGHCIAATPNCSGSA